MNLEQWAWLAQIVGVGVVIASLVYVGRQLRQNTAAYSGAFRKSFQDFIAEQMN